jgi:hypothetical protein
MKLQDYVQVERLAEKAREVIEILKEDGFVWSVRIDCWDEISAIINGDVVPIFITLEDVKRDKEKQGGNYYSTQQNGIDFWTIYKQGEDNG